VNDEKLLRSIARIAVYYARHVGLSVDKSEPLLRFARGEDVRSYPVGIPRADVVSIPEMPPRPLYHGIFLSRKAPNEPLFAYVVLFQCYEYLLEFSANTIGEAVHSCYLQNLVSGYAESRTFEWTVSAEEARAWIRERKLNDVRVNDRSASLRHYLSQRERLWIDRATVIGVTQYYKWRDRGATTEQASANALREASLVLARYGMTIEKFEIRDEDVTPD
jgi:hypothetical protein